MVAAWRDYAGEGQRLGPADSRATITVFSDFQCPFCRRAAEILGDLRDQHPRRVAVVYRHFPLPSHPQAQAAAEASECAARQGRFQQFHDTVFALQHSLGSIPWRRLAKYAAVPDLRAFSRCLEEGLGSRAVRRDVAAARAIGVEGTPTLFVNGYRWDGLPSREQLAEWVGRALADARSSR